MKKLFDFTGRLPVEKLLLGCFMVFMTLLVTVLTIIIPIQNAISAPIDKNDLLASYDLKPLPVTPRARQATLNNLQAYLQNQNKTQFKHALQTEIANNDPVAMFLYVALFGLNDKSNPENLQNLMKRSAEGGCAGAAMLYSGLMSNIDQQQSLQWLIRAAYAGESTAQLMLASNYMKGQKPIAQDKVEGLAWMMMAERQAANTTTSPAIAVMKMNVMSGISDKEKSLLQIRFNALKKKIPNVPYQLCGQATPPQSVRQNKPRSRQKNTGLFDRFPVVTSLPQLRHKLNQVSPDKKVLLIISAQWSIEHKTINRQLGDPRIAKLLGACCEILVIDETDDQSLLKYYHLIGVPAFILLENGQAKTPAKLKPGSFAHVEKFYLWLQQGVKK